MRQEPWETCGFHLSRLLVNRRGKSRRCAGGGPGRSDLRFRGRQVVRGRRDLGCGAALGRLLREVEPKSRRLGPGQSRRLPKYARCGSTALRDVVSGWNDNDDDAAAMGYDLVTGLGTLDALASSIPFTLTAPQEPDRSRVLPRTPILPGVSSLPESLKILKARFQCLPIHLRIPGCSASRPFRPRSVDRVLSYGSAGRGRWEAERPPTGTRICGLRRAGN